ncbi:hypothetical protein [Bacillus sp. FSL K6-3431]|uniref:hypothetical protein n=1 Tax=Bacillus sp. FSL K6-3431 TaxID=2921500 RepID=UPI0030FA6FCA
MAEILLTQEQLQEKLVYWQEKLRLQDWILTARIARAREMNAEYVAQVNWNLSKKMATIYILDPIDYPDDCMGDRDMENDLVHELLHLHLAPISEHFSENKAVYNTFEEQAIESIAFGLIQAERK